nr:DUF6585 family protein [Actinoplanes derwentensis]
MTRRKARCVPESVVAVADLDELGALVEIYEPTGLVLDITVLMFFLAVEVGMTFGLGWLFDESLIQRFHLVIGGLLAVVVTIVVVVTSKPRRSRPHLYEFERGLVRVDRATVEAYPWADVDYVSAVTFVPGAQGTSKTHYEYELRRHDGTTALELPGPFPGMAARISDVALDGARKSLIHTGTAVFGPVTVTRYGLTIDDEFLRWADIRSVTPGKEVVRVHYGGSHRRAWKKVWKAIPIAAVPNALALAALAGIYLPKAA